MDITDGGSTVHRGRDLGNPHRPNARGSQLSKLTGGF